MVSYPVLIDNLFFSAELTQFVTVRGVEQSARQLRNAQTLTFAPAAAPIPPSTPVQ